MDRQGLNGGAFGYVAADPFAAIPAARQGMSWAREQVGLESLEFRDLLVPNEIEEALK